MKEREKEMERQGEGGGGLCFVSFGARLTSSEVFARGEGERGEGEACSSMVGPVSHQGGSYQMVDHPTTTRH